MIKNSPPPSPPQIYQPLNTHTQEIRLLTVSPTLLNNRISCTLTTSPLAHAKHVVLSYRWGSGAPAHEILLNGQTFLIRSNLHGFLDVIRRQEGLLLWIDALCINQGDFEERSAQVRIMGEIFGRARMVLSWLGTGAGAGSTGGREMDRGGEGESSVKLAFEVMERVWATSNNDSQATDEVYGQLPMVREGATEDDMWRSIVDLCLLPYWSRIWVVQEILLSLNNYLLHGSTEPMPWHIFSNFVSLIGVRFEPPPEYARQIEKSMAKSYALSKPYTSVPNEMQWRIGTELKHDFGRAWDVDEYSLWRVLTIFGGRDCEDKRDHVFALLSLTDDGKDVSVRYDMSELGLYLNTIHFCAKSTARERDGEGNIETLFRPASQRAFFRNAKYLAEAMEIVPAYANTQPYFYGNGLGARGPSPRPDPCFPQASQTLVLLCTEIGAGNEPPVLRSSTLRRRMELISFDVLIHIDESSSWMMCTQVELDQLRVVAVITIKDGPQGRGFRIFDALNLSTTKILRLSGVQMTTTKWELGVGSECHKDFFMATILGIQPG